MNQILNVVATFRDILPPPFHDHIHTTITSIKVHSHSHHEAGRFTTWSPAHRYRIIANQYPHRYSTALSQTNIHTATVPHYRKPISTPLQYRIIANQYPHRYSTALSRSYKILKMARTVPRVLLSKSRSHFPYPPPLLCHCCYYFQQKVYRLIRLFQGKNLIFHVSSLHSVLTLFPSLQVFFCLLLADGEAVQWYVCVVCVFFPFILDIKFVGRTSRGHTGGRSHRISHPPSFCGACLIFFARRIQPFISLVDRESNFVY